MKEIPILFSAPMVQAIQQDIKGMTRRTQGLDGINENPDEWELNGLWPDKNMYEFRNKITGKFVMIKCPYGCLGDVLWVRETWYYENHMHDLTAGEPDLSSGRYSHRYVFKADNPDYPVDVGVGRHGWRPSIHMPKEACRIRLKNTGVRIERLQDITEEDARAEGITYEAAAEAGYEMWTPSFNDPDSGGIPNYKKSFEYLWESINGKGSWEKSPWVWVIEFERMVSI